MVTLTPEVELPRSVFERAWYAYLDRATYQPPVTVDFGDVLYDYVELAPTLIVPDDPASSEIVVDLDDFPTIPRRRDGTALAVEEVDDGA